MPITSEKLGECERNGRHYSGQQAVQQPRRSLLLSRQEEVGSGLLSGIGEHCVGACVA